MYIINNKFKSKKSNENQPYYTNIDIIVELNICIKFKD